MNYTEEILEQKAHVEQLRLEAEIKKWKLEVCKWQDAHSEMESAACALVESVYEKDAEIDRLIEYMKSRCVNSELTHYENYQRIEKVRKAVNISIYQGAFLDE